MQIPGFTGFLSGIFKFQVDSRFSRSHDYHGKVSEVIFSEQNNVNIMIIYKCMSTSIGIKKFATELLKMHVNRKIAMQS